MPFPGVLGRVCVHPCEQACRRGEVNEPIAICALKRYAADGQKGLWKAGSKVSNDSGKKVAVIGAGPAGLTASFYLRKHGHAVTLFESSRQAGGMLRYGIPEFRLPRGMLDNEIQEILDLGLDFRPNQSLGRDFSLDRLTNDGFDAVFLSVGARQSRQIPLEGCHTPDALWGLEKIVSQDGQVSGVDLLECTGVFDEQGNFCPAFSEKKECIRVDQVIMALFEFEEDKLFSQRESELIQKYLQEHGEMPGGGADDLDDLY